MFGWTADMYSNWIPGLVGGESENMIGEWQLSATHLTLLNKASAPATVAA